MKHYLLDHDEAPGGGEPASSHEMTCYGPVTVTPLVDTAGKPYAHVICDDVVEPPPDPPPPPPPPGDHDLFTWHEPMDGHHHGANPLDVHPAITEWLETHPHGKLFSAIGHPWYSSPAENLPDPEGKHWGFVNLAETDTGLDQGKLKGTASPIEAYIIQLHTLRTTHAYRVRIHSWKGVFLIHGPGPAIDRIVACGGWHDYGERHALYKRTLCPLPDNPPYPAKQTTDQPPYIAVAGTERKYVFWSSLTNPVIHPYFDAPPNQLCQVAWNERPWNAVSLDDCTNMATDIMHDDPRNRGMEFQVFTIKLRISDYEPGEYYTDVNGKLTQASAPGPNAVPLHIGPAVPRDDALLNRIVRHGDPDEAPILVYGADADLRMPGYGMGHG